MSEGQDKNKSDNIIMKERRIITMKKDLLNVKVVGRGCDKYFELLGIVQKAFHNKKQRVIIEEVNNEKEISRLGIRQMPALLVDGRMVVQGTTFETGMVMNALKEM